MCVVFELLFCGRLFCGVFVFFTGFVFVFVFFTGLGFVFVFVFVPVFVFDVFTFFTCFHTCTTLGKAPPLGTSKPVRRR